MCTVSWFHEPGGYQLFCNRDEKRTRRQGFEPRAFETDGVRFLAPRDGEAGGAWIAVNEFGLSLCLLNGGAGLVRARNGRLTRGLVIVDLMRSRSVPEFNHRLHGFDPRRFAPFTLLALQTGREAAVARWDGRHMEQIAGAESLMPLASSSLDASGAQAARRGQMARLLDSIGRPHAGAFLAYHRSHAPQPGPYSVCMHRPDAGTVSFTWVTVGDSEVNLYYSSGPPCRSLAGSSRCMPLRKEEPNPCLVSC